MAAGEVSPRVDLAGGIKAGGTIILREFISKEVLMRAKRLLSLALALFMLFSLSAPSFAWAAEEAGHGATLVESSGQSTERVRTHKVTIRVSPSKAKAKVYIYDRRDDGNYADAQGTKYKSGLKLPAGDYHYIATAKGYLPAEGDFTVADKNVRIKVTLQKEGQSAPTAETQPAGEQSRWMLYAGFYLVEVNLNPDPDAAVFQPMPENMFVADPDCLDNEAGQPPVQYKLTVKLEQGAIYKVIQYPDTQEPFPAQEIEYTVAASGPYTVYFRPSGTPVGEESEWTNGVHFVLAAEPQTYYAILVEQSRHGNITADVYTAKENDTVTLNAQPDDPNKYELDYFTVTASGTNDSVNVVNSNNTYTFSMPADNVIVSAVFKRITQGQEPEVYTITWKNDDNTTLAVTSADYGEYPFYTGVTPTKPAENGTHYIWTGWTPAVETATADATYTATFTEAIAKVGNTYYGELDVAVGLAPDGSTVVMLQDVEYEYPLYVSRLNAADRSITLDLGSSTLTVGSTGLVVEDGCTLTVTGNGTLNFTNGGTITVADGATCTITGGTFNFDPTRWLANGYRVSRNNGLWTVQIIPMVAEVNAQRYATFAEAVTAAENGTYWIELLTTISEPFVMPVNTYMRVHTNGHQLSVVAAEGGTVVKDVGWTETGVTLDTYSCVPSAPTYTVTAGAAPQNAGTVAGAGDYVAGTGITLTATPETGYTFANWTENGEEVSTDNPYTFTVSASRSLSANFVADTDVARVGGVGYASFAAAVTAANGEKVITLLQDIDTPYTLQLDLPVKLDRNGHTLDIEAPDWYELGCSSIDKGNCWEYSLPYESNPDATENWEGRFSNNNLVYVPEGWFVFDSNNSLPAKVTAAFVSQFIGVNQGIMTTFYATPAADDPMWTVLYGNMGNEQSGTDSYVGTFRVRGPANVSITIPAGTRYSGGFEVDHPQAALTVAYAGSQPSEPIVDFHSGTLTFTGNVNEIRLNSHASTMSATSKATITGNVGTINYVGDSAEPESSEQTFIGELYVQGTIASGFETGRQTLDLSAYSMGTHNVDLAIREVKNYTADASTLIVQNLSKGDAVGGFQIAATDTSLSPNNLVFNFNVYTDTDGDIRNTDVTLRDTQTGASALIQLDNFKMAQLKAIPSAMIEGISILGNGVVLNLEGNYYPNVQTVDYAGVTIPAGTHIGSLAINNDSIGYMKNSGADWDPTPITINGQVDSLAFYGPMKKNSVVIGSTAVVSGTSQWSTSPFGQYYNRTTRYFRVTPGTLFENGNLQALSYDTEDFANTLGSIPASSQALTTAAGNQLTGEQAAYMYINTASATDDAVAAELTSANIAAADVAAVFQVDVLAPVYGDDNSVTGTQPITELSNAVPFTFQLPADADDYAYDVLNLHQEQNGTITATKLATSNIGDTTVPVSSDRFSTYVLRKAGLVAFTASGDAVTVLIPDGTFHAGATEPVTVQHAPSGGDLVTTVTFDAAAAAAIAQNANGSAVTLTVTDTTPANSDTVTFEITMTDANGTPVYSGDGVAGTATVTLPVNMADGAVVQIVHKYGNDQQETFYATVADGKVTVVLGHFSTVEITSSSCVAKVTAANGTETGYDSLADAIGAAQDGDTVTLLADITGLTATQEIDNSITLDLNGHTLSGEESSNYGIFYVKSALTVNATNGGMIQNTGSKAAIQVGNYYSLTVNGGTFESAYNVAIWGNACTITITGGTFQGGTDSSGKGCNAVSSGLYGTASISGGTFIGGANTGGGYADAVSLRGTAAISGGTFNTLVPVAYCAPGFIPASATSGGVTTYGVQPGWKVTFDPDNGSATTVVPVPAGETVAAPDPAPAWPRPATYTYDFLEWRVSGTDTAWNFSNPVIADLTLKAAYHNETAYYIYYGETDESSGWTSCSPILLTYNSVQTGWEEYMAPVNFAEGIQLKVAKATDGTVVEWYSDQNYTVDATHAGAATFYFCPTPDSSNYKPGDEWETFHPGRYIYMAANHEVTVNIVVDGNTVTADTKRVGSGVVTATGYGTVTVKNNTTGAELKTGAPKDLTVGVAWAQSVNCYRYVNVSVKQTESEDDVNVNNSNKTFQMPDADVTVTVTVNTQHLWKASTYTYTWADDNSTVTASRQCMLCSYTETKTVSTTYTDDPPATCEDEGCRQYTATFVLPFKTQHKDVTTSPLGHDWKAPTYAWTQDGSEWKCTATRVCNRNDTHTETETATATVTTSPATCEVDGQTTYTAAFTNTAFETQTRTDVIDALYHNWVFDDFTWTGDATNGYTATANYHCSRDNTHTKTVNAAVAAPVPNVADVQRTYTATVTAQASPDGTEHTDSKTVYRIAWVDGDGTTLKTDWLEAGETPAYTGETPTKTADDQYTYTFVGWNQNGTVYDGTAAKPFPAVTHNVTYMAEYTANPIISGIDLRYNLRLQDQFSIGFLIGTTLPTGTTASEYTVIVTDESNAVLVNKKFSELSTDGSYYSFIAKAFTSKEMTEKVHLVLKHNDVVIKETDCSIQSYCDAILNGQYEQNLKNLCQYVLNYGAEAQRYFNYKTDTLANANHSDTSNMADIPPSFMPTGSGTICTGITETRANLNLDSKTVLNFRFTHESGYDEDSFEYLVKKGDSVYTNTSITTEGNVIILSIKGIMAKELGDKFTVTITNINDRTYRTSEGSAVSYVYLSQLGDAISEALAKAFYNYYYVAYTYFNN